MSFEDRLRETLHRAVRVEPPVADALDRVRRRARRGMRIRLVAVPALATVAVASLAVGVPQLVRERREPPVRPAASPAPSSIPRPTLLPTGQVSYVDRVAGFALSHPASWTEIHAGPDRFVAFVGPSDVSPSSLGYPFAPPAQCSRCPAIVSIRYQTSETGPLVARASRIVKAWGDAGAKTNYLPPPRVAGRSGVGWEAVFPDRDASAAEWCRGCRVRLLVINWGQFKPTLEIRIVFQDAKAFQRDGAAALTIVDGIETVAARVQSPAATQAPTPAPTDPSIWPKEPYTPKHGGVAADVPLDRWTTTFLRLMDARVDGNGADTYLSPRAKSQFDVNEGGLNLYSPSACARWAWYDATREAVDAGSYIFHVQVTWEHGGSSAETFKEDLVVGTGDNYRSRSLDDGVVITGARWVSATVNTCPSPPPSPPGPP